MDAIVGGETTGTNFSKFEFLRFSSLESPGELELGSEVSKLVPTSISSNFLPPDRKNKITIPKSLPDKFLVLVRTCQNSGNGCDSRRRNHRNKFFKNWIFEISLPNLRSGSQQWLEEVFWRSFVSFSQWSGRIGGNPVSIHPFRSQYRRRSSIFYIEVTSNFFSAQKNFFWNHFFLIFFSKI